MSTFPASQDESIGLTGVDFANQQLLRSFDQFLTTEALPVSLPPEPTLEGVDADEWSDDETAEASPIVASGPSATSSTSSSITTKPAYTSSIASLQANIPLDGFQGDDLEFEEDECTLLVNEVVFDRLRALSEKLNFESPSETIDFLLRQYEVVQHFTKVSAGLLSPSASKASTYRSSSTFPSSSSSSILPSSSSSSSSSSSILPSSSSSSSLPSSSSSSLPSSSSSSTSSSSTSSTSSSSSSSSPSPSPPAFPTLAPFWVDRLQQQIGVSWKANPFGLQALAPPSHPEIQKGLSDLHESTGFYPPAGYIGFAAEIGAGTLGRCRVYVPSGSFGFHDMRLHAYRLREKFRQVPAPHHSFQLHRLVAFGQDTEEDLWFGWLQSDVASPLAPSLQASGALHDLPVYCFDESEEADPPVKIAQSFQEWVECVALGPRLQLLGLKKYRPGRNDADDSSSKWSSDDDDGDDFASIAKPPQTFLPFPKSAF